MEDGEEKGEPGERTLGKVPTPQEVEAREAVSKGRGASSDLHG